VQAPQGWIRQPQRFPVRIMLLPSEGDARFDAGRSGAQANVVIFTSNKSVMNPIASVWIRIVTLLSYLQ
jgi:hypothetical protein